MRKLGILIAVVLFGLVVFAQEVDIDSLLNRIELLEEYTNMIYDVLGTKAGAEELAALNDQINNVLSKLESIKPEIIDELQPTFDDLKVALDIHDSDILKIYDTLGMLSEQIATLQESTSSEELIESLALKLDMHDQDIVNLYDNLSTKADREDVQMLEASLTTLEENVNGLSDILSGLAAQIGDTDYLLRKAIENAQKDLNAKIDTKADKEVLETIANRLDLLEEYANSLYETLGTKVSADELEMAMTELDERISTIETDLLNVKSTVETGLPALRDMLYELSSNLASTEERLTSYIEEVVAENVNTLQAKIDTKADKESVDTAIKELNSKVNAKADKESVDTAIKELNSKVDTKADAKAVEEKVNNVNMIAWIGVVLGAVALVLPFVIK